MNPYICHGFLWVLNIKRGKGIWLGDTDLDLIPTEMELSWGYSRHGDNYHE